MDEIQIVEKFGNKYSLTKDTYHMGVHMKLAELIAKRYIGHKSCLDACVGGGMTAIYLSKYVDKVIAVDINKEHLKQAESNSELAGVKNRIDFIAVDIIDVIENLSIDSAFLDPDWDTLGDREKHVSDLKDMTPPGDVLFKKVLCKTPNICLRLPKEFDLSKLNDFPPHESEKVFLDEKLKFYCVYFGDLMRKVGETELRV